MNTLVFIRDEVNWFSSVLHVMPGYLAIWKVSLLIDKYTTLGGSIIKWLIPSLVWVTHKTENTGQFFYLLTQQVEGLIQTNPSNQIIKRKDFGDSRDLTFDWWILSSHVRSSHLNDYMGRSGNQTCVISLARRSFTIQLYPQILLLLVSCTPSEA